MVTVRELISTSCPQNFNFVVLLAVASDLAIKMLSLGFCPLLHYAFNCKFLMKGNLVLISHQENFISLLRKVHSSGKFCFRLNIMSPIVSLINSSIPLTPCSHQGFVKPEVSSLECIAAKIRISGSPGFMKGLSAAMLDKQITLSCVPALSLRFVLGLLFILVQECCVVLLSLKRRE